MKKLAALAAVTAALAAASTANALPYGGQCQIENPIDNVTWTTVQIGTPSGIAIYRSVRGDITNQCPSSTQPLLPTKIGALIYMVRDGITLGLRTNENKNSRVVEAIYLQDCFVGYVGRTPSAPSTSYSVRGYGWYTLANGSSATSPVVHSDTVWMRCR